MKPNAVLLCLSLIILPLMLNHTPSTIVLTNITSSPQLPVALKTVNVPLASAPVGPNVDIAGESLPDRQRVETTVSIDPLNPNIIVAGAQDLRLKPLEHRWHGYYRSTDGGQTWTSSLLPGFPGDTSPSVLFSPLHGSNATTDPVVAFDRQGNLYYAGLVMNISQFGNGGIIANSTAFVAKYSNDGASYFGATLIKGPFGADKPWIAIDTTGGPHDGTVYLAFDASLTGPNGNFATVFTGSVDGGRTFAPPYYVPADLTGNGAGMTVDPSGYIYVSTAAFDPVTYVSLNYTQVTKISPGGVSIIQNVKAVSPTHLLPYNLPGAQFRTFTFPQMASDANGVYLVFDDWQNAPPPFVGGSANIYLSRSMDGGSTWTQPLRINDDGSIGAQHFFPTIAASGGILSVAWYDSRQCCVTVGSIDVYFSESLDGGASFLPNTRVTTSSFNPNTANRTDVFPVDHPFMGDYIGIAATPTTAYPVWADNRNVCDTTDSTYGCVDQDAYTSAISLADFAIAGSPSTLMVQPEATGTSNITLTSINNYQGTVTVSATTSPNGLPVTPTTTSLTLTPSGTRSFNLTFSPTPTTTIQTYTVRVTGTGGPRVHSSLITVTVASSSVGGTILPLQPAALLLHLLETTSPIAAIILAALILPIAFYKYRKRKLV